MVRLHAAQQNQCTALASNSREEGPRQPQGFDHASAQMMHENSFTSRAGPFPDYQTQYQQPVSFNQFPHQTMQTPSATAFRQHEQYGPDSQGKKERKSSNVKGTVGGGLLGFALTGRLSGLAGGAMVGNMILKRRK
ncbi:uncharacterized protein N7496_008306 [Penicillium cataractarum]|uniref:Uncharacterized protein n=1 Tax=Penicillium cataractarum TaxID=2100454 RepID=A0A9W9V6X8_9EURO|nr:uncharacterized protein N7496_008306 [Penicillium cataractarum]KAJ5368546.1 hypothetical protein N7496_008306 [Penicillium cataractarum]